MIQVSNSDIKLWRRCPQAYSYKRVEGIVRKRVSLPLKRGTLIHKLIELYYLGKNWEEYLTTFAKGFYKLTEEEQDYYGDLPADAFRMMEGYVAQYQDLQEEPIAVEMSFYEDPIEIHPKVALTGKVDLILKNRKGLWVTEHKTHKVIPDESDRFLDLQTLIYIRLVETRIQEPITGVLWDYIRTKPPTVPQVLKDGTISKAKKIDTDYKTFYKAILDAKQDPADYTEQLELARKRVFYQRSYMPKSTRLMDALFQDLLRTALEMDKLMYHPYRNIDKFKCKQCEYRLLCEAELMGMDADFIRKHEYTTADYRKEDSANGYDEEEN